LFRASGLGRATVLDLHSQGGFVAVLDINNDNGEAFVKELGVERAKFFQVDVSETESVAAAVKGAVAWSKHTGKEIVGVVAAAGVGHPGKVRP